MRKTIRRRLQTIMVLSILGGIVLSTNGEEENLVDIYENRYEETTLESRCYLQQLNRMNKEKPVQQGYCENKENLEKFRLKENGSILEKLSLTDCRIVQSEEEHIKQGRGSVYATDIACIRGQSFDVKAVSFGTISKIGEDERLGTYLVLKQDGTEWIYGHTQTSLKVGDEISKGDVIGQTNLTGMTQNYHLHFETWKNGVNTSSEDFVNDKSLKLKMQRGWLTKEDTDKQNTPSSSVNIDNLAYAVAMAETANCTKGYGKIYNNCFGIKNGNTAPCKSVGKNKMCIYSSPEESYEAFKKIWKRWYKDIPNIKLATRWTGKDHRETWLDNVNHYYYN